MDLDALENSHPIEVEVRNSSEVDEIFDAISYNKGSAVIAMVTPQSTNVLLAESPSRLPCASPWMGDDPGDV